MSVDLQEVAVNAKKCTIRGRLISPKYAWEIADVYIQNWPHQYHEHKRGGRWCTDAVSSSLHAQRCATLWPSFRSSGHGTQRRSPFLPLCLSLYLIPPPPHLSTALCSILVNVSVLIERWQSPLHQHQKMDISRCHLSIQSGLCGDLRLNRKRCSRSSGCFPYSFRIRAFTHAFSLSLACWLASLLALPCSKSLACYCSFSLSLAISRSSCLVSFLSLSCPAFFLSFSLGRGRVWVYTIIFGSHSGCACDFCLLSCSTIVTPLQIYVHIVSVLTYLCMCLCVDEWMCVRLWEKEIMMKRKRGGERNRVCANWLPCDIRKRTLFSYALQSCSTHSVLTRLLCDFVAECVRSTTEEQEGFRQWKAHNTLHSPSGRFKSPSRRPDKRVPLGNEGWFF